MQNSGRHSAGVDLTNLRVRICGLAAKYWLLYFIVVQLILGISNLIFFVSKARYKNGADTSSGILNLICVVALLFAFWFQSKTFFTILTAILGIDTVAEFYLLFTRIILTLEVDSPFYSDYLILVLFSAIRVCFSATFTVVLLRLSWCNGLRDEDDLEKMAIYECIEQSTSFECENCAESEKIDKID